MPRPHDLVTSVPAPPPSTSGPLRPRSAPAVTVTVNGREQQLATSATIADLVGELAPSPKGVAVARNGEIVPRSLWHATALREGDRVEILTAVAGG